MPTTINIPLTTLTTANPIIVPSTAIPTGLTSYLLLLDRHAGASPLFQQPLSTVLTFLIEIDENNDGSWPTKQTITCPGGPDGTDKFGNVVTTAGGGSSIPGNPTNPNRMVRAHVFTTATVSASGTLTLN